MVDKMVDDKEASELRKVCNHYLDKRSDILKNTQFKVEDIFDDVISEDSISPEQITKLKKVLAKKMWI